MLIPAFAIGRAQEVILILLRAQLANEIPRFPIRVDGMVRKACDIYASHPWYLQSTLRRRIEKHGDPFFDVLENVQPVGRPSERAEILAGEPAVIVSSSGMLTGGPSPFYASALAADSRNLIAITGYQDEEAPGRRLLDVAAGRLDTITLGDREVELRCRVATYALSGHASGAQIATIAGAVKAADVFLVHGDVEARRDLADLLLRERLGRIHLPRHGTPIEVEAKADTKSARDTRRSSRDDRRLRVVGVGNVPPHSAFEEDAARSLSDHVLEVYPEGAAFSAAELHRIWYGVAAAAESASEVFETALRESTAFAIHPTRLFLFVAQPESAVAHDRGIDGGGVEDVNSLLRRIDEALPAADSDLVKKSYEPGSSHMVLHFAFPDRATEKFGDRLAALFADSGWSWEIHATANSAALGREIRAAVPDARLVVKEPSVRLEERSATLFLSRALFDEEMPEWEAAVGAVLGKTGFTLNLVVKPRTARAKRARDDAGRLEINLAYEAIRRAFVDEDHAPRRIGKRPGAAGGESFVELTFVSEAIGSRYADKIAALGHETGWTIAIAARNDQSGIVEVARELLRDVKIRKGPSYDGAARTVTAKLAMPIDAAQRAEIEDGFSQ